MPPVPKYLRRTYPFPKDLLCRRLDTRSSLAFLRGAYNLQHEAAKPALNTSYVAAILATLVCAFVITSAVVVAIIL